MAKGPHRKFLICIENAKIEKIKTYFSSKIVSKENYVFQNAKYVCWGEIKNFPWEKYFFPKSEIHTFLSNLACFLPVRQRFFLGKQRNLSRAFPAMITQRLHQIWCDAMGKKP